VSTAQLLLRRLIDQAGGAGETGYILVIEGEGLENLPPEMPTTKGTYSVHRVGTELGLRHLLWKAKGAPLIAVMPEDVARRIQNAPDILRRARNQRVHALSVNDILEVVLGVRVVGADAPYIQKLALDHVDKLGMAMSQRTLPTVVDRRLLTELLVDVSVGIRVRTQTPAQLLVAWVQEPPQWPENVRSLVQEMLPSLHGDEGRLLAWALAEPEVRLRQLLTHGAVLTIEETDVPKNAWGPLWKAATEAPLEMDRRILRRVLSRLAEEAFAGLGDAAASLLSEADRVARGALTPAQLQTSRLLPLAFLDKCHSLAQQAADHKPIQGAEIAWLSGHQAARLHSEELAVLEAMARISRYLDQPFSPQPDVVVQVRDYQRNGAFADLAMLHLRRALASNTNYLLEAKKVLAACREKRDRENKHFAETIARGYETELHKSNLTPLHRLWKRTVVPVWQQDPTAHLFLVVLDGCSYPIFLELLHALSQHGKFPIGVRPDDEGRVCGLPALAPLPTITSHARGAIFLGELPQDALLAETVFRDQDEPKTDKARFKQNASLEQRERQLFLKGDLTDGGQALLAALEDDTVSVVATVFNAVDDQIGSSNTGAMAKLAPEHITAFLPALQRAILAKRRVLLTADHGHTLFIDKSLRRGNGKTPRFATLAKNAEPAEGFIEIDLGGLGGPPERRAFAWQSGVYLGSQQVGFHGGCGLEEMVVPLAWLERDGLHADEPAWWYGGGALPAPAPAPRPVEPPIAAPLPSDDLPVAKPQLSLFEVSDRAAALPLPAPLLARLSGDEKAVLVLLRETGSARASELAAQLKKNPVRLNGLMRTLRRTLHTEGHVLFSDEQLPSGETMYRYLGKEVP